jgi:hypothetical protein avisC_02045
MVTRSEQLSTIGLSLADLVLEVFCFAASPSFKAVATLVATARQAVNDVGTSSPEFVKDRSMLSKRVIEVLTKKVKAAREQCLDRGIDASLLAQAESAVAALISTDAEEDLVVLSAVRDPEGFEKFFTTRAAKHRQQIEEQSEPYFDALVRAVAATYVEIAPWSDSFVVSALKSMLDEFTGMKEQMTIHHMEDRQLFDQILQLLQSLAEAIEELRKPSHTKRVNFGSRPDVVVGGRFVERDEHEQLKAVITDPTRHKTVLLGMRGCGKTQLAASLAKQCENANWNLVAWINAVSRESIQSDLVELAKRLKIDTSDLPTQDEVIRRCLNHLQSVGPADRLIVFDNVEDINYLTGLIPSGDGMRVVATTTNKVGWEDQGWNSIKVGVFDRNTSIEYLLTVTNSDDREAADTLAEHLGDLPVAVAQAAATARNKDLSLARYLQRLDSRGEELVIRPIPGDEYTDDVAMVLWMAVEAAVDSMKNGTKEMARRQLRALALLAESGVPTRWLDPTVEQLDDDESPDTQRDTDEDAHDALTKLIHRSIVHQSADKATTMLHRLQAQVLRDSWSEEEREQACESAAALLGSVDIDRFRADDSDARFQETRNLIEHLRAFGAQDCFLHLRDYRHFTSALCRAFTHARDIGLVPEVFALKELVNTLHKQVGDSRETLSLLAKLAYAHMYMSDYPAAISLYKQVLNTREQILEPNHRDILSTRNDLAYAYYWEGHTDKAIDLFEQVLDDRTRILSSDHEDTLMTGSYLALAYADDGQLERAITLGEQVVKDRDRVLKPDHKYTLVTRNNLADAYKSVGRLTDAIKMYEYVLEARIRTLGSTHHHTRITRNDLAQTYEQAGDLPKAISMYEDLHNDYIQIYGADHESTIEVRDRLEATKQKLEQQENATPAE